MTMTVADVKAWSERPGVLKSGSRGEDVKILQTLLSGFLDDTIAPLSADGIFGQKTLVASIEYQQQRLLEPDGAIGTLTKRDMYRAFVDQWTDRNPFMLKTSTGDVKVWGKFIDTCGSIPYSYGEVSCFGGPKDEGDLMYGQAYLSEMGTTGPSSFCTKWKDLVSINILRKECLVMPTYPIVTLRSGQMVKAGPSWCLDPQQGWYCAIYTKGFGLQGMKNPRVVVINPKNGKVGVFLRTDHGPQPACGAIDLPYHIPDTMGLVQDDKAIIGWADWDITPGFKGILL